MLPFVRSLGLFIALASITLPARADPVLMFLLGFARNLIESSLVARPGSGPKLGGEALPKTYPGTSVQPEHLQRLIEDCFTHLSAQQRGEIFETLHAELLKPKNAAIRSEMIQYFAQTALQVRALQIRLAQLSTAEKVALAAEFGKVAAELPVQERVQLREIIERRLLPVPGDLGELLAGEIARQTLPPPIPAAQSELASAAATPTDPERATSRDTATAR